MKDSLIDGAIALFVGAFLWYFVSAAAFMVRHPWATQTEILMHPVIVMSLQRVDYYDWRPLPPKEVRNAE